MNQRFIEKMRNKFRTTLGVAGLLGLSGLSGLSAATIEELEARIAELEVQAGRTGGKTSLPSLRDSVDLDNSFGGGSGRSSGGWFEKTSLGGYGELHLNTGDVDEIDFHRWVLFVNHEFNDRLRLFSEIELEHSVAGDGQAGEVELEQAFIEYDATDRLALRAGLFLVPVGILNETHEPNTFFGVERNNVEVNIIPTTWREGGIGVNADLGNGFGLDWSFHSGLDVDGLGEGSDFNIRSGRESVAEAAAESWASTARMRYTGVEGLALSGFVQYQSDLTQGDPLGEKNDAILFGASLDYRVGGFGLRALYSRWDIDGASFEAADADTQEGYYVEPSYTWTLPNNHKLGVFGRYAHYEFYSGDRVEVDEVTVGVNYWPHDRVVLKADYNMADENGGSDTETVNFGVGYQF